MYSAFVYSVFMYFVFMYCVLLYCSVVECSGRLVQLMFAAACGRRPKLTSHFIVCSEEKEEDGDENGNED